MSSGRHCGGSCSRARASASAESDISAKFQPPPICRKLYKSSNSWILQE